MSTLLLNTLTGKTSAGSIVVTGEGGSTTTNMQQGLAKAWVNFDGTGGSAGQNRTINNSQNISSVYDNGEGDFTINAGQRLANVLNEKGEHKAALVLVDQFIEQNKSSISLMLMKLKLSLITKTPAELGYYVDEILSKLKNENN